MMVMTFTPITRMAAGLMQTPKETKTTKTSMKTTQINYDRDKDDEEDDVRSEQEEEEENQSPT
jgi:hypothetical protein